MRFGQNVEAYIHKGLRSNKVSPRTKPGRFVGICKLSSANLVYFQSVNKVRPCAHTIAINDSTGTHGSGVRGHNASQDVYDEPHAAQDSAHGWLTPPRAATPEVESPIYNTPGLTEPQGQPYTPLECEDDPPNAQPMHMSGNDSVSRSSCGCPLTENVNSRPGTHHDVAEPTMNNDGHFVDDRSRHNTRPIRDRHAPIRYGDPVIDYEYSPDHCFNLCSLGLCLQCKYGPANIKTSNVIG